MLTVYLPGGICWKLYSPSAFDFLVCINPLSRFERVISARGVTAPPGSTTVPYKELTAVCGSALGAQVRVRMTLKSNILALHSLIRIPPRNSERSKLSEPNKNTSTGAHRNPETDTREWFIVQSSAPRFFLFSPAKLFSSWSVTPCWAETKPAPKET